MTSSISISKLYPLLNLNASCQNVLQKRLKINSTGKRSLSNTPKLWSEKNKEDYDSNNPINRTFKVLRNDFQFLKKLVPQRFRESNSKEEKPFHRYIKNENEMSPSEGFQTHCDVLIIGGGGIGSSIAYWLKQKARDGLNVVLVEKDTEYRSSSTVQAVHGLNQHFSLPENIQMALFGAEFMRGIKDHMDDVNLNFTPYGSLILASEQHAEILKTNVKMQNELGVRNELLSPEKLKFKFPWLNTDGIALGCHALEKQGWFDPLALLIGYKTKARDYGAHFVEGEIIDFDFQLQTDVFVEGDNSDSYYSLDKAVVRMPDGEKRTIKFGICIIAAGSKSGDIGRLARIGCAPGLLTIPLPLEPRKRHTYIINSENNDMPLFSAPFTVDTNGTYFRRNGLSGDYLCGQNRINLNGENTEADEHIFKTEILPTLANRVNAFESAKVKSSWSDIYEYNNFDESGIMGAHPYYNNLYIAAGFNAYGMQLTPAVGRGLSELIIDGRYRTIDLERLSFDRLVVNQPMYESSNA